MFRLLPILTIVLVACIGGCHDDGAASVDTRSGNAVPAASTCPMAARSAAASGGVAGDLAAEAAPGSDACVGDACEERPSECDTPVCPKQQCDGQPRKCCPSQQKPAPEVPKAND